MVPWIIWWFCKFRERSVNKTIHRDESDDADSFKVCLEIEAEDSERRSDSSESVQMTLGRGERSRS